MKLKKFEITALLIAAAALVFTFGFFVGRGGRGGEVVIESSAGVYEPSDYIDKTKEETTEAAEVPADVVVIDINSATAAQLESLPGIGETLGKRIIQYREKIGRFTAIEEITNVEGIGSKKFEAIKDCITVK